MKNRVPPEIQIHGITGVAPDVDGRVIVVRAESLLQNVRTELEIAVTTELAPAMALALLATTAQARANRDDLEPALDALAGAVVRSRSPDKVRLQLLFDNGAVLPVELAIDAAEALSKGLAEYLAVARQRGGHSM